MGPRWRVDQQRGLEEGPKSISCNPWTNRSSGQTVISLYSPLYKIRKQGAPVFFYGGLVAHRGEAKPEKYPSGRPTPREDPGGWLRL